jgi:hypothetical protein
MNKSFGSCTIACPHSPDLLASDLTQILSILLLFACYLIHLYLYYSLFLFDCIASQNVSTLYKNLFCSLELSYPVVLFLPFVCSFSISLVCSLLILLALYLTVCSLSTPSLPTKPRSPWTCFYWLVKPSYRSCPT